MNRFAATLPPWVNVFDAIVGIFQPFLPVMGTVIGALIGGLISMLVTRRTLTEQTAREERAAEREAVAARRRDAEAKAARFDPLTKRLIDHEHAWPIVLPYLTGRTDGDMQIDSFSPSTRLANISRLLVRDIKETELIASEFGDVEISVACLAVRRAVVDLLSQVAPTPAEWDKAVRENQAKVSDQFSTASSAVSRKIENLQLQIVIAKRRSTEVNFSVEDIAEPNAN
ncbi:hypothetical protein F8O01_13775 [Pseudoclavibacter chungangensis]|uniref:Uncharacterized protein n=1 Tax=Pseudoclavibacter chungangensis TaxID=587635 RepID=A0A7J5BNY1_9MICO|nr:hypothetical protein [Pseudoclavibacter chungangensis]KAB1654298.1 hypothetical protein F8O01_13775 [Pseudoclavibacter chungangensis]NYJ65293.1 hypothetical protein [Pseudoclavibacter chungangensis]